MPSSTTFGLTEYLPGLLMAAGISLLCLLVIMNLRFKLQRRSASRHISPVFAAGMAGGGNPDFESADHHHRAVAARTGRQPTVIDDARVVEAHDSVRHLINALDTRCKSLEVLLRQADERIRQLEDALDDRVGASISPTRTALPERGRRSPADSTGDAAPESPSLATADPDRRTRPVPVEVRSNGSACFDGPIDPLTANVYELADRGCQPGEIARHLDEQIGKVELILALRSDR